MITNKELNQIILFLTLILMSYYILSSIGINIFNIFNTSCNLENESFINTNLNNKITYKNNIENNIRNDNEEIRKENRKENRVVTSKKNNIENFDEEYKINNTSLLLGDLIKKVWNQDGFSNVNRNRNKDLRGDVLVNNYSGNYTPFYTNESLYI